MWPRVGTSRGQKGQNATARPEQSPLLTRAILIQKFLLVNPGWLLFYFKLSLQTQLLDCKFKEIKITLDRVQRRTTVRTTMSKVWAKVSINRQKKKKPWNHLAWERKFKINPIAILTAYEVTDQWTSRKNDIVFKPLHFRISYFLKGVTEFLIMFYYLKWREIKCFQTLSTVTYTKSRIEPLYWEW